MPATASANYSFVVDAAPPPLAITSTPPPPGNVGQAYSFQFTAAGGVPPYTWTLVPVLPGLTLDPVSGILSGTPTVAGSTAITVTVTDSAP